MKYRRLPKWKYQLRATEITDVRPWLGAVSAVVPKPLSRVLSLTGGSLVIGKGYAWDGPSGPAFDTKNFMRGSLVHDALYQLIREGYLPPVYRKQADRALRGICRQDGMSRFRAAYVYRFVRWFGRRAARPLRRRKR